METTKNKATSNAADLKLVLERVFDAPRHLVFEAWTKPEHLVNWCAPEGFTIPESKGEFREGGEWYSLLIAPDGEKYPVSGVYIEIVPDQLLVMSHGWIEDDGTRPHETVLKVRFADQGKKTKLTLEQTLFKSVESRDGHKGGWTQCLDKLAAHIDHTSFALDTSESEIVITRIVNAPRELVWDAITNPEHVVNWWGPDGFTTKIEQMDVRPGGTWTLIMRGPDGTEYPNKSVFKEIVRPERITYSLSGRHKGGPSISMDFEWLFEVIDENKTRVTIHQIYSSAADRDKVVREFGALEGGKQCLARLAEFVSTSGGTAFEITRTFDAPRELVWKAWTDPKQMTQWWGPRGFANPICELDVRVGGAWRTVMRSSEGVDYPCAGVYREIIEQEKLVMTMDCTGHPDEWWDMVDPNRDKTQAPVLVMLETVTFEKLGDKTKLTVRITFDSAAIRDSMLKMGMTEGWSQSLERLSELVSKS